MDLPWAPPLPPREKGRRRRDDIVEAASRMVDDRGHRQVTVRALAEGSGTSPATIYHYFPDLDAIMAAVASAYLELLATTVGAVLDRDEPRVERFVGQAVDAFRTVFAGHPGLRELWFSRRASARIVAIHEHYLDQLADTLHHKAARTLTDPGERIRYRAVLEAQGALWELAFALDPDGDQRVVDEMISRVSHVLRVGVAADAGHRPRRSADGRAGPTAGTGPDGVAALRASLDAGPRPWETPLPRQARSRARRETILRAASELIDAHGPHSDAVSVRAIADRAGVPAAAIHQYFGDVEGLTASVAVRYMDTQLQLADDCYVRPDVDAQARTERFVRAHRRHLCDHPGLRALWFDHYASDSVAAVHHHYQLTAAAMSLEVSTRLTARPGDLLDHVMLITQAGALWEFAFEIDRRGHPDVIDEITALMLERNGGPVAAGLWGPG